MKKFFIVLTMSLIVLNLYAQEYPRLMALPAKQTPVMGQSLYVFTVNMRSERSVVLAIDDVKIGHFFNGESAEIVVPDGRHVVKAFQMRWDNRTKGWIDDNDDRLTDTLNGEKLPVDVNPGPKLRSGRSAKVAYNNSTQNQVSQGPQVSTQPARPTTGQSAKPGIEGAVARASVVFIGELPRRSTIAVISVSSKDTELATFAIDELEYQLVTAKQFTMVDRKTLDAIRSEQNFQLTGEVSDQSAVSIGQLLGASIVITGTISGTGNIQRLTLKALDVKTAQIITMAREQF
jgi:hypothetical protein